MIFNILLINLRLSAYSSFKLIELSIILEEQRIVDIFQNYYGLLYKTISVKITLILLYLYNIDLISLKRLFSLVNFKYNFF